LADPHQLAVHPAADGKGRMFHPSPELREHHTERLFASPGFWGRSCHRRRCRTRAAMGRGETSISTSYVLAIPDARPKRLVNHRHGLARPRGGAQDRFAAQGNRQDLLARAPARSGRSSRCHVPEGSPGMRRFQPTSARGRASQGNRQIGHENWTDWPAKQGQRSLASESSQACRSAPESSGV
jgi:hypothetical protein